MRHDEQVRLVKEMLVRLDTGTNVDAGGIRHNPTSVYVDPALANDERTTFFRQHPQIVGLSCDLPRPGSFFTVDELPVPVLAARDGDGNFVAIMNICRHRGARLVTEACGDTRRFTCAFHNVRQRWRTRGCPET
jgi:carnitine monooxygenase subunit